MLLEVLDQALLVFSGQGAAVRDVNDELLEALQGGLLSLALILLPGHLLAEPEHCNSKTRGSNVKYFES